MAAELINISCIDGVEFKIPRADCKQSRTLSDLLEDVEPGQNIPLPNVTGKVFAKVMEYIELKKKDGEGEEKLKEFINGLTSDSNFTNLFDLILAANYLNIKELLEITCQKVADLIKGKKPEEIRRTFNIKNDFTPEEEEEILRENQWAFD